MLIAAGMLIHGSIRALNVDTGYDIKHLIALEVRDDAQHRAIRKTALVLELRARLATLPGVSAITNAAPPIDGYRVAALSLNGEPFYACFIEFYALFA